MKISGKTIFVPIPLEKQDLVVAWKNKLVLLNEDIKSRIMLLIENDLGILNEGDTNGK